VALIKQTLIGVKPQEVVDLIEPGVQKLALIPELEKWMDSIAASSERLRKKS